MAAGMGLRGGDQLVAALEAAARELAGLTSAHQAAGQLLATAGERTAPRRTGTLAKSHGYTVVAGRATVTAAAPYAGYVHARNPWLARDLAQLEDQLIDIYAQGAADAIAHNIT